MKTLILSVLLALSMSPAFSEELPVEYFAKLPVVKWPAVSPDGAHIAVLVRNESGYYDVMVTPFGKNDFVVLASLKKAYDRIEWIGWANNERLLVSASAPENIGAHHFRISRLYSIGIDGKEVLQLSRPVQRQSQRTYRDEGDVISLLRDDPDHVLVEQWDDNDDGPVVYKVNVYTNEFEKLFRNEHNVRAWFTNGKGEVVAGLALDDFDDVDRNDLLRTFWFRTPGTEEWKKLKSFELGKDGIFIPISIDETGKFAYVISDHEVGRRSLYLYDIEEAKFEELLYSVDGYDIAGPIEIDDRLVGVTWYDNYLRQHYFDPKDGALLDVVKKTFKGAEVSISSTDEARRKIVVYAVRDNTPGKYFLLDLETGSASFWFSQYPELEKAALASMSPFQYEARDGMVLNGYLTLPVNAGDAKPPLVVLPHGGPQARDYQYFDYWTQFLANRGYAVLQPNFRGSTGFGSRYEALGYREWGKAMQTDVLDAIAWVEEQGLADTSRMCLVGASYGGYVALTASYKTPDRFDCFVSIAGISDLYDMVVDDARFSNVDMTYSQLIGNYKNDADAKDMRANSAINFVERITKPILLFHGTKDTQVSYSQSQYFYRLANAKNKDVEYIELDDATHYLDFGPNRVRVLSEVGEFLSEHLE